MPLRHLAAVRALAARQVTAFATDAIPRTTRAQSMDTLSSMANIAGYKGVLLAAVELNKYFPMLMTAAGMVPPAKVFVIGAGVAGLQAIATAKRLGANVVGHRRAARGEGADRERRREVRRHRARGERARPAAATPRSCRRRTRRGSGSSSPPRCAQSDVVITTALIGGVFAPRLITADMVRSDEAGRGDRGPGGRRRRQLRAVAAGRDGARSAASPSWRRSTCRPRMPLHASLLFSRNLTAFVLAFTKDKAFQLDLNDDIQQGALITHDGEVRHARTREALAKEGA